MTSYGKQWALSGIGTGHEEYGCSACGGAEGEDREVENGPNDL